MKNTLLVLLSLTILNCGGGSDGSSASSSEGPVLPLSCETPVTAHNGCCSSHDGIATGDPHCPDGQVLYDADQHVVCNDTSFKSTCTFD